MWWGGLNKFCLLSYLFSFFFKIKNCLIALYKNFSNIKNKSF
jgi:hypothetical protein